MKITHRQNGKMMFTITVKFHIGKDSLINRAADLLQVGNLLPKSRTAWVKEMKSCAFTYGRAMSYTSEEDVDPPGRDHVEQATEAIRKLFPEMFI